MGEEFLFLGSVKDNVPRSVQKGRVDKRMIQTSREKFVIESGEEYTLLDAKERGDLYGIRIVSDNPYLEVFLSLDDWRPENTSAAEILLQPQTGRLLSNFEAADGGHPGIGYSLTYNPDIPEEYDGRIRIVLKNRIRPQYTKGEGALEGIFSAGNYTAKGGAPQPLYNGHGAGFMVNLPFLERGIAEGYREAVGYAIAQMPNLPSYDVQGGFYLPNSQVQFGTTKGALHPYLGLAGRPVLEVDIGVVANDSIHVFFDDPPSGQAGPPRGVGPWASQNSQNIYLVDFSGTEIDSQLLDSSNEMQPVFFRDGGNFYFPGFLEQASKGGALPTKFATNGGSAYSGLNVMQLSVIPGLRTAPPPFFTERPVHEDDGVGWGMCRTGHDTYLHSPGGSFREFRVKPQIYVKSAEVKRLKRVSYDG